MMVLLAWYVVINYPSPCMHIYVIDEGWLYDEQGIAVQQRESLPDIFVPKNATVEITAKISAGYHTETIRTEEVFEQLRNLSAIRQRCGLIQYVIT